MFSKSGDSFPRPPGRVVIVGAGLAGLACATRLQEAGAEWLLIEAEQAPGGRVRTHLTPGGYRIDHGFQVLLDSYPTARRLLDLEALKPCYFESGALMAGLEGWERLLNPIHHPASLLAAVASPSFSLREKIILGSYAVRQLLCSDESHLAREAGLSTKEELARLGLDGAVMEKFLGPFFSGVFLDDELGSDASIFRYDLKKFALGRALLPAEGMGAIPRQLASRLPSESVRYGARVDSLQFNGEIPSAVILAGGEVIPFDFLVLATDEKTSLRLRGNGDSRGRPWKEVSTLYFTGDRPLYEGGLLVLPTAVSASHNRKRIVTHFTDLTNTAPDYAPPGKRLLSATVLHTSSNHCPDHGDLEKLVLGARAEIESLLPSFQEWEFLQEVRIRHALPSQAPGFMKSRPERRPLRNLWLAGDQVAHASIDSALTSGLDTADEVLNCLASPNFSNS